MNPQYTSFAAHSFSGLDDLPFSPESYSHLKFGSDRVAKQFGYDLAESFFSAHAPVLMANRCVVIPSPYNFVPNAATVMGKHFTNRLNQLLVAANGEHVEWSIIHRKVSYVNDYGFLTKEKRRSLIDNDQFYLNRKFLKGKVLIFLDDVKITGTHEEKLIEVLQREQLKNQAMFLYYGQFDFKGRNADIESKLNFAGIKNIDDYLELSNEDNHHLIVRPIKFILSREADSFDKVLRDSRKEFVAELYNACLGEGYYKIPSYQTNFQKLSEAFRT